MIPAGPLRGRPALHMSDLVSLCGQDMPTGAFSPPSALTSLAAALIASWICSSEGCSTTDGTCSCSSTLKMGRSRNSGPPTAVEARRRLSTEKLARMADSRDCGAGGAGGGRGGWGAHGMEGEGRGAAQAGRIVVLKEPQSPYSVEDHCSNTQSRQAAGGAAPASPALPPCFPAASHVPTGTGRYRKPVSGTCGTTTRFCVARHRADAQSATLTPAHRSPPTAAAALRDLLPAAEHRSLAAKKGGRTWHMPRVQWSRNRAHASGASRTSGFSRGQAAAKSSSSSQPRCTSPLRTASASTCRRTKAACRRAGWEGGGAWDQGGKLKQEDGKQVRRNEERVRWQRARAHINN